ncbi:MAG: PD-(D/E)XK nuclease family transposase, partial [Desulfovibrio sp.]|nr:PD-(D/E)XK nuclease family transposase [Desulfovibrio sp.]
MPTKEQIREKIKNLTLMDDVLFHEAAKDKEFCEEILRVFLDDPNLCVLEEKPQKKLINLEGRSITIDLVCRLGDNTIVNVEVQKNNNVNHKKRVRYHASMLTTNTTDPGQQGNRFYFFLKNIKNNTYIESKKNFYNELENKISKFPESISAKSDSE